MSKRSQRNGHLEKEKGKGADPKDGEMTQGKLGHI